VALEAQGWFRLNEDPPIGDSDRKELVVPLHAEQVVPLHAEQIDVDRVKRETGRVKISTVTRLREHVVDETLSEERVQVSHVDVGRVVDAVPDIRIEGDTTIIPVVEEVLVVEKRLLLKQEVHITRIRTTTRHQETIVLREQEAIVTRTGPGAAADEKNPTFNENGDDNGK
jgi:stress response protein YsnF